ncbi:hypothetical protein Zm00014a_030463 [Zea mays]|uniref:Uncharacterized protein n=1 Tax=Zea mays TaxID=4577 RepID=A0A3L6DMI0_MAIZE|nr:hypothetical protein Zm00014a_030463 [Zea mays]
MISRVDRSYGLDKVARHDQVD